MTGILWKQFSGEYKALGDGRVEAVMSSESVDRDGDVIRQDFWNLKEFESHPVLMADHNYGILHQIGKWSGVHVAEGQLRGTATYHIGKGNERADWAYHLAEAGEAAFSVGFIPDMSKAVEIDDKGMFGSFEFRGQTLLETSQVAIPSNPDAVQLMRSKWAKSLAERQSDALWAADGTGVANGTNVLAEQDARAAALDWINNFKGRLEALEARQEFDIDDIIERLKADYPHLVMIDPIREAVSKW
tara:strand:- start:1987 stop:2721 length:735 start_codon:yes stop_codon:yes gene_type:complete